MMLLEEDEVQSFLQLIIKNTRNYLKMQTKCPNCTSTA